MANEALIMKSHKQIIAPELPFHIIRDVMANLPLKSLLRFKLVSTQWLDEITNQDFARAQLLNHQKKVSSVFINTRHIMAYLEAKTLYVDKNALEAAKSPGPGGLRRFELRLPIDLSKELISSMNICDGILCSVFNCFSSILLWNPITNWYKIVPFYRSEDIRYLGFGYNPSDNDYKIFMAVYSLDYSCLYVEIFSLKSCTWKRVCSISTDDFAINSCYPPVHINGTFYWCQTHDLESGIYVLSFDLVEEKFSKIPMPRPSAEHAARSIAAFTSYRGMLCMIWGIIKCIKSHEKCGHEIWVMKEGNNWEKLWEIPVHLGYPVCCTHEGAVFLTADNIFIHDNEKGTIEAFQVHGLRGYPEIHVNIGYVGSLVEPLVAEKPPVIHAYSRKKRRSSSKEMVP